MPTAPEPPATNGTGLPDSGGTALRISVVVPVFQGERTLGDLVGELMPWTTERLSPGGNWFRVTEVILVNDGAVDGSSQVMQALAEVHPFVRPVWLSRNFGQHPATLAGMASSSGDWVVTMDEDGQHDPADIAPMLDLACASDAQLAYAQATNLAPHGWWRNATSRGAKWLGGLLIGTRAAGAYSSFRLIQGEIARSLAAYCGQGVFLDVALSWVVARVVCCPVTLRTERGRASGYTMGRLLSHFWRLVLTIGTRPLRIIAILGGISILTSVAISAYVIWAKVAHHVPIQGWTSLITAVCLFSGLILFSLGVIAEYLAMTLTMAMGKPLYLSVSPPGPGRHTRR